MAKVKKSGTSNQSEKIRPALTPEARENQLIYLATNLAEQQLRDGTAKLIYARARQMGYAVQEVKKGTQTQLVLVRCE